jgi:hypothetical protein
MKNIEILELMVDLCDVTPIDVRIIELLSKRFNGDISRDIDVCEYLTSRSIDVVIADNIRDQIGDELYKKIRINTVEDYISYEDIVNIAVKNIKNNKYEEFSLIHRYSDKMVINILKRLTTHPRLFMSNVKYVYILKSKVLFRNIVKNFYEYIIINHSLCDDNLLEHVVNLMSDSMIQSVSPYEVSDKLLVTLLNRLSYKDAIGVIGTVYLRRPIVYELYKININKRNYSYDELLATPSNLTDHLNGYYKIKHKLILSWGKE